MELSGGVIVPPGFVQKKLEVTSVLNGAARQLGGQLQEKSSLQKL